MSKASFTLERKAKSTNVHIIADNVKDAVVKVGFLRGLGEHPDATDGQTVAEIAFWNEFGTKRIPARSFMRSTLRENKLNYKQAFKEALRQVLRQKISSRRAIGRIALKVQTDIQQKITTVTSPPNTWLTILRKKGKQNPLINTGHMKNSVSWEHSR